MRTRPLLALVAATFLAADLCHAQEARGHVLDADNRRAIGDAAVFLVDSDGRERDAAVTPIDGQFKVSGPAGAYRLLIRHVAYEEITSREITLVANESITVEVLMDRVPRIFETVTVTDTRPRAAEKGGYYRRRAIGAGRYISKEDIQRRGPTFLTDMLDGLPGIMVRDGDFRVTSNAAFPGCMPTVVLDNIPLRKRGQRLGIRLDDVIRPEHVEAVEVYARGSGIPAQYGGRESPCGAIFIWTSR